MSTPAPLDDARLLVGRYRIKELLGRGGMGAVWAGYDEVLHREVAIKEVLPSPDLTPVQRETLRKRTMREARAAARIAHPSAVTVYDVIEADGRPWIVMQLLPSQTLADLLHDPGPLAPTVAVDVGLDLLDALGAAHQVGVLHRDVKPANVILTQAGRAVLTDFGIATVEDDPALTSTGILIGSPGYMSPERARGETPTPASDLWSLGATLYAATEGESPFHRESQLLTLTAVVTQAAPLAGHAGPLQPVIAQLLAKDPADRPSAEQARELLLQAKKSLTQPGTDVPEKQAAEVPAADVPAAEIPAADVPGADVPAGAGQEGTEAVTGPAAPYADLFASPALPSPAASPVLPSPAASPALPSPAASPAPSPSAPSSPVAPPTQPRTIPAQRGSAKRVSRRGALMLVLPLIAAAVVVLVLVQSHSNDHGTGTSAGSAGPGASPSAVTASRTANPVPTTTVPTATVPTTTVPAEATSSVAAKPPAARSSSSRSTSKNVVPASFQVRHDSTGFSVAVPRTWTRSAKGTSVYFSDPQGSARLQVDTTTHPQPDALRDWQNKETSAGTRYPGYHRLRLVSVAYRGWDAADWEYTWHPSGGTLRVLNRNIRIDDHRAYALVWSVPSGQWQQRWSDFQAIAKTFEPAT